MKNNRTVEVFKNDTILLSKVSYDINYNDNHTLELRINDSLLIDKINNLKKPIFKIDIEDNLKIAKGNSMFSSTIPDNCDYFYPLDINDKPFIVNGVLNFKKSPD